MTELRGVTYVHGGFARVGGIETFATDLLFELRARKLETELICWSGRGQSENPALKNLAALGVRTFRTSLHRGCRWGWPDTAMVLHRWKRLAESEVLVFGKILHHNAQRLIIPLRKKMILITPYRPMEMWAERQPDIEILNSFESIIVQAQAFEEDLRRFGYKGKTFNLPYLPPKLQSSSRWPTGSQMQIGYLGRLVADKNLGYLIDSFSRLRAMGVDAQLHIFGDGPERYALQSLTNEMNLASHIEFHGNQERATIPAAIDSCHLFAFSSRTEGQCLSALEILARGRRVLGTPAGAFPEFLSGLLGSVAPLDDPAAFAIALRDIAKPVIEGSITPKEVQHAYQSQFPRQQVIAGYLRVFGCSDSIDEESQDL
jgi:glycosyltransferase involved in cell wall biosynthesis